ncbi:MAG: MFS transporter [Sulfurimonas sp. RIFOXYD12_FULL_33_39]|uniref:MFS transporter n=1 Tax=unclassified Sulfurimonas TaxID=2623549 RepID=UPI0008BCA0EC|nr:MULTISPECIES: MFS transporter [unclassified Sulfurimonas]OHE07459.1 MAG: MFS transporter [Sulfurimonas sp. RIFCSPLOWO2_12_FULL_34_6]OHE09274.1 MAG: MFS transporter [Sulfurimonas sp. RIFOXYD12_FULL_33_39]OHE12943.1 MAG: MFS transporter [Sulfurimonas sp. RIFOXYD2_FULL_34_21]DAB27818.1 MAG TPA: MFS transporter [Sulfurimonas sp. UBA10385]
MQSEKKSVYSWALYDWANSAYATTVMAGFFPLFFKSYYSSQTDVTLSTAQLGIANSVSSLIIVLIAPLLGAIADAASFKKRFLFIFAFLGILMSASMSLVQEGEWQMAAFIYILGNIGFMGSNTFYDGLLQSVSSKKNVDFVSGLGFSLGYLGGGILFSLNVWMVQDYAFFGLESNAAAVKASFISVAIWWAIFSIPLMLFVKEEQKADKKTHNHFKDGYIRLKNTFRKITKLKHVALFLVAYWLYIDGVDTIIRMAVDYGMALGFDSKNLIFALLLVQFIGFPATLIFTKIAHFWDTKKAIYLAIGIYLLIITLASLMQEVYEFYILAVMIALVQGGIQALSRSYYSKMIPKEYSAEFFAFYNFMGKFAAIFGPLLIAGVALFTHSSRISIASISVLFILGGALLYFVDEEKGEKELHDALVHN